MENNNQNKYQTIVIGGGHAGIEAALATARMGLKTALITHNIATIGEMSCNPSIGGIGKSHLVKEIDALGGIMAAAIDHAGIQFRTLNASKGPAVRATRAQADRVLYKQFILKNLQQQSNLTLIQQTVDKLIIDGDKITGVETNLGIKFHAPTVILTVGTFLNGTIHIGLKSFAGGRAGDSPSITLAEQLRSFGFSVDRLKTGTPPRIAGNSINYDKLQKQPGDVPIPIFSFLGQASDHPPQIVCHIAHTNEKTHAIIRAGLDKSPLYSGVITSAGPRYCPSIEDKIVRFADKTSHQIFIEPEGLTTNEVYPNGISTSLAYDIQVELVRSIEGFEQAHIVRPGYAIEYDFFDPRELHYSLETKKIAGLFFAGQINGTTGYEEAAAQGLLAGINTGLKLRAKELWCPGRDQAYMGVMVDDLITCGTAEPYRMFTSRAEYRLLLREDNADLRLTEIGHKLGIITEARWSAFCYKRNAIELEKERLKQILIRPQQKLKIARPISALELLKRPEISYALLATIPEFGSHYVDSTIAEQIEIQLKYAGYIERQTQEIARRRRNEETKIPTDFCYDKIPGLSTEARQKLLTVNPATIGQAARIPGITPAAISLLLVYLKKWK